jgi:hypothetical protein
MRIVPQVASISHSLFTPSTIPLLSAPPERKLLSAPRIAGLLCAPRTAAVEVIIEKPLTLEDIFKQIGPIRLLEEMNAEIAEMAHGAIEQLLAIRARYRSGWVS